MRMSSDPSCGWGRGPTGKSCFASAAIALLSQVLSSPAEAQRAPESPYCRKVGARAGEDAALLMWPRLLVEGHRFPASADTLGPTLGNGDFQVRVGVSFSPTDLVRGVRVGGAADADCDLQEAAQTLHDLVVEAANDATLPALR